MNSDSLTNSTAAYEQGLRLVQVTLCRILSAKYEQTLELETAKTLAAQVVNYLKGEDIEDVMQRSDEPLKSKIARISAQVPDYAARAMVEDKGTREVVVPTLRMKMVLNYWLIGDSYFKSADKARAESLLRAYGTEFPDEITPAAYWGLAQRYYKQRW